MMARPLIGVAGSVRTDEMEQFVLRDYLRAVLDAGGLPVLLSMDMDDDALAECCASRLDGLLLAGGNDLSSALFGEEPLPQMGEVNPLRDRFELKLLKRVLPMQMPVLGICRGIQVINVALGGTLWQDIPAQCAQSQVAHKSLPAKEPCHYVSVEKGSALHRIAGEERLHVNSTHHQAVRNVAPGLRVCARADDGIIEAIESPDAPFLVGVQWHPERLYDRYAHAAALFRAFVDACPRYHAI